MLTLEDGSRFVPGEIRTREVTVGRHIAPEAAIVPRLMDYFSSHYVSEKLGLSQRIISLAAAQCLLEAFRIILPT